MPIVVMGVAGSGKSTVGESLAARLGVPFVDSDRLHPAPVSFEANFVLGRSLTKVGPAT